MRAEAIGGEQGHAGRYLEPGPQVLFDRRSPRGLNARVEVIVADAGSGQRDLICRYLCLSGMVAHAVSTGAELDAMMEAVWPDLVVIDANLPDEDGFFLAARIRAAGSVGIVMLTDSDRLDDRIMALSAGADVCIERPVHFRELEAQLCSLTRRLRAARFPKSDRPPARPADPCWSLNTTSWSLSSPDGKPVPLTNSEYRVLQAVMEEPGTPSTREEIASVLGKTLNGYDDRSLDAVITRLRRKVNGATGENLPLRSVRGVGYVFAGRVEQR